LSFDTTAGLHTYGQLLCPGCAASYADGQLMTALYNPALGKSLTLTGLIGVTGSGPSATNYKKNAYGGDTMWPLVGVFCSHYSRSMTAANFPCYMYVDWMRFSGLNAD
jgi:hypothetical protein